MGNLVRFTVQQMLNADAARGWAEKRRLKVNAADIQTSEVFTGAGDNDLTPAGTYTGVRGIIYKVKIDAEGTPDTISWYKDGVLQAAGVAITGSAQNLDLGVTVAFVGTDNHDVGDFWEFEATITTDRLVIAKEDTMYLLISLDQKVWYRWAVASSEPAASPITSTAVADGDTVQSLILPAGDSQLLRVPWGLLDTRQGGANSKRLYLWIEKHTSDALMQVAEQ